MPLNSAMQKYIVEKNNSKLLSNEEIIGALESIVKIENDIKITISIEKRFIIPFESKLFNKIQKQIGTKIGIINLDGKYRMRKIKKSVQLAETFNEIKQTNKTKHRKSSKHANKKDSTNSSNMLDQHERIVEKVDRLLNQAEKK